MTPALSLVEPHVHKWLQYTLFNEHDPYYVGWECEACGEQGYEVPDERPR